VAETSAETVAPAVETQASATVSEAEAAATTGDAAVEENVCNMGNCFPPETLVGTEAGMRPIGQIEAGQRVWAYDFLGANWRLCPVEFRRDSFYNGVIVSLDCGLGKVAATLFHPFWVIQGRELENRPDLREVNTNDDRGQSLPGRWVNSQDLREGDIIFLRERGPIAVSQVAVRRERTPVCNLTIQGLHTYCVGEMQVLVHNTPGCPISNVPGEDFVPNSDITTPYSRPSAAGPTAAQRASVQGQPCVECGAVTPNQVADHIEPLVVQYYRQGAVDVAQQSTVEAVQAHCPHCSAVQGGQLSGFAKAMKNLLGL
jgi:hypothetical protein